jgi:lipopolysaccharide/colanic/teichoic acid biosynthesis glycosyltransferase
MSAPAHKVSPGSRRARPVRLVAVPPNAAPDRRFARAAKRALDVAGASIGLALSLPVLALAAIAIRLDSPGPVLFCQLRCGREGRRFCFWKLRTMVDGAEAQQALLQARNEMDGPMFKMRCDPRVTRVGRFLRRYSLDEVPQLWNVLVGDMSLVGPRPPLPREVLAYQPRERERLAVTPGLTGPWQVSGRNDLSFAQYVELDLEYVRSWSVGRDLQILARTIPAVFRGDGAC